MRYDGDFQVGFYGSGALMQDIPESIISWLKTLPDDYINDEVEKEAQYISDMLKDKIKSISDSDEDVELEWDNFSNIALVVLDIINNIAKTHPDIEIAVGVEITFSVTDTTDYFSYYSPAGSDTICKSRKDNSVWSLDDYIYDDEASEKKVCILNKYNAENADGNICEFKLYSNSVSIDEYNDFISKNIDETDFGKNILVMEYVFKYAIMLWQDGQWKDAAGKVFLGEGCDDFFETLEEEYENEYSVKEFFSKERPWYEYPDYFIEILMKISLGDLEKEIEVKTINGKPHFLTPDGGEYFFGIMLEETTTEVIPQWNFPDEAHFFNFTEPDVDIFSDDYNDDGYDDEPFWDD